MTPELWERLKPLFNQAVERPSPERGAFIAEVCGDDAELKQQLLALVEAHDRAESATEQTTVQFMRMVTMAIPSGLSAGDLVLNRFKIVRHLGAGGMGDVYEASDGELSQTIALKMIRHEIAGNANMLARFKKEVRLARQINGPNICRTHELFVLNGTDGSPYGAFLTMEYLDGITLADRVKAGPLSWHEAEAVASDICAGLTTIHQAGIIHRDLKSRNIMLTDRGGAKRAVLMDFGLAREFDLPSRTADTGFTLPGAVLGTPEYMAPEQFVGAELTPAADVYSLGVVLYEIVTGTHPFAASTPIGAAALRGKRPLLPTSIQPKLPRRCNEVILKCLEHDPNRRYQSASEVAEHLKKRIIVQRKSIRLLAGLMCLIVGGAASVWWKGTQLREGKPVAHLILAVLPFDNIGGEKDIDYLRIALPDEIATTLSHVHSISIRPFATTSKYMGQEADILKAGREMHVSNVVTGHFLKSANEIRVTLELVNVETNQTIWRDTLSAADQSMITLRQEVLAKIRNGLVPVLDPTFGPYELGPRPSSEEAYDIYLHSKALSDDPFPNKEAIQMLQHVVALDASYAPAWAALGQRYYFDSRYSDGGEAAFHRSISALETAQNLDPDLIFVVAYLATVHAEQGDLEKAYLEAQGAVNRRPENGSVHFSLAYVLRYAGLLNLAQHECEIALELDPGNPEFRSCAKAFYLDGNYRRAQDYLNLDIGTDYAKRSEVVMLLRQGKKTEALERVRSLTGEFDMRLVEACLQGTTHSEITRLSRMTVAHLVSDPEIIYWTAGIEASCGRDEDALNLLDRAVRGQYCSHPAIDLDPLLVRLRNFDEFQRIRAQASRCQGSFVAFRNHHPG